MGVAFALLDELLQLLPERPDTDALKEIDDVLREIRDLAQTGLKIVKVATGVIENPDGREMRPAEAVSTPRSRRS